MPTPLPRTPAERLAGIIDVLCGALAAQGIKGRLVGTLLILVWNRLRRTGTRIAALAARVAAGTLRPPRPRLRAAPAPAPQTTADVPRIPGGFGWLLRQVQGVAGGRAQLNHLLNEPDMVALIAAAPQIGRHLRPLCRMLGLRPPPHLALPRRPRRPSPPRTPPAKAATPGTRRTRRAPRPAPPAPFRPPAPLRRQAHGPPDQA